MMLWGNQWKFFEYSINCFIPVENIVSRAIIAVEKISDERVLVVIPLLNN